MKPLVFAHPQPNRSFGLVSAALIHRNSKAFALEVDFEMLRQVSSIHNRDASSLSLRALNAANQIMSVFGSSDRFQSTEDTNAVLDRCRDIAATVLGKYEGEDRQKLCTIGKDSIPKNVKLWAIGHWSVSWPPSASKYFPVIWLMYVHSTLSGLMLSVISILAGSGTSLSHNKRLLGLGLVRYADIPLSVCRIA